MAHEKSGIKLIELDEKGNPQLTPMGKSVPELAELKSADHTSGQKYFAVQLKWLFFVYCQSSNVYFHYSLKDRKTKVFSDKIGEGSIKKLEGTPLMKAVITKIQEIQFLPEERFRNSARKKMEELMDFYDETPVTHENFKEIGNMVNGANGVINNYKTLKDMATEERKKAEKNKGNVESTLFEDPLNT